MVFSSCFYFLVLVIYPGFTFTGQNQTDLNISYQLVDLFHSPLGYGRRRRKALILIFVLGGFLWGVFGWHGNKFNTRLVLGITRADICN